MVIETEEVYLTTPKKTVTVPVGLITEDYLIQTTKKGKEIRVKAYDSRYIKFFAEKLKERIVWKWPNDILMAGKRRVGKSCLAIRIARTMHPTMAINDIVFTLKELNHNLKTNPTANPSLNLFPQIMFDEAGFDLFMENWNNFYQKELVKKYEVIGAKYQTIYLIAPGDFVNSKMKNFSTFLIYCCEDNLERGVAELYELKDKKFGKPWYNPIAAFQFDELHDDFWDEYEKKKFAFIDDVCEKEPDEERMSNRRKIQLEQRNKAITLLYKSSKLSQNELSKQLGLSPPLINKIVNESNQ